MSSRSSARSRTKRLLRQLFELQLFDLELTAPFCLETKFLLKNNKHCSSIQITTQDQSPDIAIPSLDYSVLPRFIGSQLEEQRLTASTSRQVSLACLLDLILALIPSTVSRKDSCPTFFYWQCSQSHKTYFVFVFLAKDVAMPSGPYSVDELLRLRGGPRPAALAAFARANPELADVFAIGGSVLSEPKSASNTKGRCNSRSELKTMDDSSTGSDEIVYKGNPSRRSAATDVEWKYRGRSGSELTATEPLSAPTGLTAQQSEGFQRFYKAVVSPTHVRVTAGGRIVPNTRALSSPTSKRTKEKLSTETQSPSGPQAAKQQNDGVPLVKGPAVPFFAMAQHFFPQFHPQFAHLGATMPMMPMAMGMGMPGGFAYPQPTAPSATGAPTQAVDTTLKENQAKKTGVGDAKPGPEADKAENKVKLSPPEQFDHTKPFVYNGQLMYPVPAPFPSQMGAPYLPPGYMAHPGYPVHHFPSPMMGPPHMAMNTMMSQMGFPSSSPAPAPVSAPVGNPGPSGPVPTAEHQPPSAPPISSIRPSDITRKQIDSLRSALKYHEDQLQYNRHQIDEKDMERTIKMLEEQIDRFEKINEAQHEYEDKHYPKKNVERAKQVRPEQGGLPKSPPLDAAVAMLDTATQSGSRAGSFRKKDFLKVRPGLSIRQHNQPIQTMPSFAPVDSVMMANDPMKKSTLPSGAALAPPFEPRAASGQADIETGPPSFDESLFQHDEELEKRLLAAAAGSDWPTWTVPASSTFTNGIHEDKDDQGDMPVDEQADLGRPYLVGKLPAGVDPQTARDEDYVYDRQLTEDEIRARFLHWGKAPQYARQGLPKYDGKNFYPASPVKDSLSNMLYGPINPKHRFERSGRDTTDPFRPATPLNGERSGKQPASKEDTPSNDESKHVGERLPPRAGTSSESDARPIEYQDRRVGEGAGARFLNTMLKRGITRSSDVLPSAMSPTTAQGVLPQYTSYGTLVASISPVLVSPDSPSRVASGKPVDNGVDLLTTITERHEENRRPLAGGVDLAPGTLEQQFRNIVSIDAKQRAALPAHWKPS